MKFNYTKNKMPNILKMTNHPPSPAGIVDDLLLLRLAGDEVDDKPEKNNYRAPSSRNFNDI